MALVFALACCASRPIDCGYRPHVRTARDAEARDIDLSRAEEAKVADLNYYKLKTELSDTAREYGIEDHVFVVHAVIEGVSPISDGGAVLHLRDGDFRVLAYVPGSACSTGSVFASQIAAVRAAITRGALHPGDLVVVRSLVFFDHAPQRGAARGAALSPVLSVTTPDGSTFGLTAVSTP